MEDDLFKPIPGEGVMPHRPETDTPKEPEIPKDGPILARVQNSGPGTWTAAGPSCGPASPTMIKAT